MNAHTLFSHAQRAAIDGDVTTLHGLTANLCKLDDVEYIIWHIFAHAVLHGQLEVCVFVREFLGIAHCALNAQVIRDAVTCAEHDQYYAVARYIAEWI